MKYLLIAGLVTLGAAASFAADEDISRSLEATGHAVVCGFATDRDLSTLQGKVNSKLGQISGNVEVSKPALSLTTGRLKAAQFALCVTISKKQ